MRLDVTQAIKEVTMMKATVCKAPSLRYFTVYFNPTTHKRAAIITPTLQENKLRFKGMVSYSGFVAKGAQRRMRFTPLWVEVWTLRFEGWVGVQWVKIEKKVS